MKYLVLAILSFLLSDIRANETPLMSETSKKIRELAALDGFTDQDAIDVSKFLFISLVGSKQDNSLSEDSKFVARTRISKNEEVIVFVCYDFGIGFLGYDFAFRRGDPAKGLRFAHFESLRVVPSE